VLEAGPALGGARKGLVDGARTITQVRQIAVVFDDEVGACASAFRFDLSRYACPNSSLVKLIALDDPGDSLLERCDHQDRLVDEPVVTGFKEQRDYVDDELARFGASLSLDREALDMGMEQSVEAFACGWIVEDDLGQRRAIEHARTRDLGPNASDLAKAVAIGCDDFARERVGVYNVGAEVCEEGGNGALSRTDAAG
jgi:hypothetical protein